MYNYHETDDQDASIYGMTYDEVIDLINDHNDYFDTDYRTIDEFNEGEEKANGIRYIENA